MNVQKQGFNSILEDNEEQYYSLLQGIISSIDEWAYVQIVKSPSSLSVRISPSLPSISQLLLKEILNFHNLLKIQLELSKSIKNSTNIQYKIPIFV